MANPEHLKVMLAGNGAIEEWWSSHPSEIFDLSEAELGGAILRGADLRGMNLKRADLSEAFLGNVDFSGAELDGANFGDSDLSGATFTDASLLDANLGCADLSGANLTGTDLSGADLGCARLLGACLRDAVLSGANLRGALLCDADCRGTHLAGANFRNANLAGADLTGAVVFGTSFHETDLSGTNFTDAIAASTEFVNVDLSVARNLDKVVHHGPSSVGVDTLFRSSGGIPETFLNGCGVPNILINFLPTVFGSGDEYYSSFISYSHKDEEFARFLYSRMRKEKLRVWFAPVDIKGGMKLHEQIGRAIQFHDKLLIVVSENSMNSEWVKTEIADARKREADEGVQVLFPVRLVGMDAIQSWKCFDADIGKDSAREIREFYIPDFTNWKDPDAFEREFGKLLKGMRNSRPATQREKRG